MMSPSLYATSLLARDGVISVKHKESANTARRVIFSSFKRNKQTLADGVLCLNESVFIRCLFSYDAFCGTWPD